MAAALEVYGAVRSEGHLADRALERVLRRERRLHSAERRAVAERVYRLLRQERRIDFQLFAGAAPHLPATELHALRYAAACVLEGQRPEEVAARLSLPAAAPRVLERVRGELTPSLSAPTRVALEGSVPDFLAELLVRELGESDALAFARAAGERAPLTLRANLLKGDRLSLLRRLSDEGVAAAPTRFSPLGAALESRVNAFGLSAFKDGLFEIQDEGSQLIAQLVQAGPGERVVDACAGAGGKALALAADMQNKGELTALDAHADRLAELGRRARRAGVFNLRIKAIPADGDGAERALEGLFGRADRVLVDAPCTGLGTLRRNPDARYRFKPGDVERYAALQRELLARFARLARRGGRVVYATCSVAREENERVVESFLASGAPFRLVPASAILPAETASGPYLRLFPHRHGTDGFFAAALERVV
jgi:16S rRNA (cytosine967-C5)-methyltransferase